MRPRQRGSLTPFSWPLVLGGLLVAWIVFHCLPWDIFGWHHPLWDKAAEVLGQTLRPSLSVDREASLMHLFRLLTYAGYFFIAWQVGQRTEGAALIIEAVAIVGTVYAVYGLIEWSSNLSSSHPTILWFMEKDAYQKDLTATFVNRNSFATFAGLSVIANLVLFANVLAKTIDLRTRATTASSMLEVLSRGKWWVAGLLFVGAALLLSHSRGGMISTLAGIAAL